MADHSVTNLRLWRVRDTTEGDFVRPFLVDAVSRRAWIPRVPEGPYSLSLRYGETPQDKTSPERAARRRARPDPARRARTRSDPANDSR